MTTPCLLSSNSPQNMALKHCQSGVPLSLPGLPWGTSVTASTSQLRPICSSGEKQRKTQVPHKRCMALLGHQSSERPGIDFLNFQKLASRDLKGSFSLQRQCPMKNSTLRACLPPIPPQTPFVVAIIHSPLLTTLTLVYKRIFHLPPLAFWLIKASPPYQLCHMTRFSQWNVNRHEVCQI